MGRRGGKRGPAGRDSTGAVAELFKGVGVCPIKKTAGKRNPKNRKIWRIIDLLREGGGFVFCNIILFLA
jgi:hypothetical protein